MLKWLKKQKTPESVRHKNMPCNVADSELTAAFRKVEGVNGPSGIHRACLLRTRDGIVHPRVVCSEDARGFHTDWWISPEVIDSVEESPFAIPAKIAQKIYDAGESGMGYQVFTLIFRDGSKQVFVTPNALDFPDLPDGYTSKEIVDALPHEGREEVRVGRYRESAEFEFCFYVPYDGKKKI